jgi:hypothetical protein
MKMKLRTKFLATGLSLVLAGAGLWTWAGEPYKPAEAPKLEMSMDILRHCYGQNGVWADPTRYRGQLWTRDFSLAMMPVLPYLPGGLKIAEKHLESLAALEAQLGHTPIVFLDGVQGHVMFLKDKITRMAKTGKTSFMLKRYMQGELWNLTPGTTDSDLHFVRALQLFQKQRPLSPTLQAAYDRTLARLIKSLQPTPDGGLVMLGADWRDTMDQVLANQPLLSNNALLYGVLLRANRTDLSVKVRQGLTSRVGGLLGDYPGESHPDPFGLSLGVLEGLIPPDLYPDVRRLWAVADTAYGVHILCKHNPQNKEEALVIERTGGKVVWPFIVGYRILAGRFIDDPDVSSQEKKFERLPSFHEWVDPATGKGYGAPLQGWSAALYFLVATTRLPE